MNAGTPPTTRRVVLGSLIALALLFGLMLVGPLAAVQPAEAAPYPPPGRCGGDTVQLVTCCTIYYVQ